MCKGIDVLRKGLQKNSGMPYAEGWDNVPDVYIEQSKEDIDECARSLVDALRSFLETKQGRLYHIEYDGTEEKESVWLKRDNAIVDYQVKNYVKPKEVEGASSDLTGVLISLFIGLQGYNGYKGSDDDVNLEHYYDGTGFVYEAYTQQMVGDFKGRHDKIAIRLVASVEGEVVCRYSEFDGKVESGK